MTSGERGILILASSKRSNYNRKETDEQKAVPEFVSEN